MTMLHETVTQSDRFKRLDKRELRNLWESVARCISGRPSDHFCEEHGCHDVAPLLIAFDEQAALLRNLSSLSAGPRTCREDKTMTARWSETLNEQPQKERE